MYTPFEHLKQWLCMNITDFLDFLEDVIVFLNNLLDFIKEVVEYLKHFIDFLQDVLTPQGCHAIDGLKGPNLMDLPKISLSISLIS